MSVIELSEKYKQYIINLRRYFHTYPEPSFKEFNTSKKIKEELERLKIPYISTTNTGVVATLKGNSKGKTVALRSDMDALEITECTNISYKSKNIGFMHACGHDGHLASLLGAAMILKELQSEIKGTVKLIFQPSEETGLGAKIIIDEGFLKNVDGIFGIHLISDLEVGKISVEAGPRMASADSFKITVKGKSCHGATPYKGVDALVAASSIVLNLQSFVSREIDPLDPAVISIGKITSGSSYNIIASEAIMEGTTRCFSAETRARIPKAIKRIAEFTAKAYNAEAVVNYNFTVPPLINDASVSTIAEDVISKISSKDAVAKMDKLFIAEDFAKYLEIIPGAFAFVGVKSKNSETNYPLHNDKFNIDEDCLPLASAMHAQFAIDFLNKASEKK